MGAGEKVGEKMRESGGFGRWQRRREHEHFLDVRLGFYRGRSLNNSCRLFLIKETQVDKGRN